MTKLNDYPEYFADGSVSITVYVCILEAQPLGNPNIPQNLITIDKNKAFRLKKEYGYEVYSTRLLREVME